jgi:uncharacterized protein (TIGR00299 family) protein
VIVLALLDPFSGVAGDMFIGALLDLGLPSSFIEALPHKLGLDAVGVRIARVRRAGLSATKVDFAIPQQPHGRHLNEMIDLIDRSAAPADVKERAANAFRLIASIEADVHGTAIEHVHLHEVGAVDAVLDVVGSIWGLAALDVSDVRCGPIAVGDGFVDTAHGRLPVPAPATLRLLEQQTVRSGPPDSGELTTPTGAALVRVLSSGAPPASYVPLRTGYGAGTKDFPQRPNVLRITIADVPNADAGHETLLMLAADIDDSSPEHLAVAADHLRALGALDVTCGPVTMKKGRLGTRVEVLTTPASADLLESALFQSTSTLGVRRTTMMRRSLARHEESVKILGHAVAVKWARLPDGSFRMKPELDDVRAVAAATGRPLDEVTTLAIAEAQRTRSRV